MNINERQAHILVAVINEYVETAQPVASKTIVEKFNLGVSPATVRNDMAQLEAVGYLRQPHTSAGRVPTEEGYRFYLTVQKLSRQAKRISAPLKQIAQEDTIDVFAKNVADELVRMTGETAFVSLKTGAGQKKVHYTGLNNLFEKPDFDDLQKLRKLSGILDGLVDRIGALEAADGRDKIWIGSENPISDQISTMIVKYDLSDTSRGIIGLMGPLRMNYKKNMKLLCEARNVMEGYGR